MVVVVVVVVSKAAWHFWSPVFVVKVLDRLNLILVILQVDAISFFLSWIDRLSFFLLLSFSFFFLFLSFFFVTKTQKTSSNFE